MDAAFPRIMQRNELGSGRHCSTCGVWQTCRSLFIPGWSLQRHKNQAVIGTVSESKVRGSEPTSPRWVCIRYVESLLFSPGRPALRVNAVGFRLITF